MTLCIAILCALPSYAEAGQIQSVRVGDHNKKIRLVIETDTRTNETLEIENNKLRIGLPATQCPESDNDVLQIVPLAPIKRLRACSTKSQISFLSFDLTDDQWHTDTHFWLEGGTANEKAKYRLVIDLEQGRPTPVSTKPIQKPPLKFAPPLSTKPNQSMKADTASYIPVITPPSKAQNIKSRKKIIVIDAGHGGKDPGAIGAGKYKEKDVTLSVAKALQSTLKSSGRYTVYLTRDTDIFIPLKERVAIARRKEADIFISLHADSVDDPSVQGASVYTLSDTASDKQTARLAKQENQVDLIGGVDLSHTEKDVANILLDLSMRNTMNQSRYLAENVVKQLKKSGIKTLPSPHRHAGFAVLKAHDVPAILIEMGFMSNTKEVNRLHSKTDKNKMVQHIQQAIDQFFDK